MPRSDWGIVVALIGCLGLAWLALGDAHYRENKATAANDHRKRTYQVETDRAGIPFEAERFASNPEPKTTDEREKRDLAAQEASAAWGFWVAFFAAIQLIATIFGLYYIKRTLDATLTAVEDTGKATLAMKEANRISRQMAERARWSEVRAKIRYDADAKARDDSERRQLRAYVGARNISVVNFLPGRKPTFIAEIINFGQTPAFDVTSKVFPMSVIGNPHTAKCMIGRPDEVSRSILYPNDPNLTDVTGNAALSQIDWDNHSFKHYTMIFVGIVSYRDVFGKRHITTFKTFLRHELLDNDGRSMMSNCSKGNVAN